MSLNGLGLVYLPFCCLLLVAGYPVTDNTATADTEEDKEPRCSAAKAAKLRKSCTSILSTDSGTVFYRSQSASVTDKAVGGVKVEKNTVKHRNG